MPNLTQTTTRVHDDNQLRLQRAAGRLRERNVLYAVMLFAQLLIGGAVYLLPVASTGAWWTALLLTLPLMALYLLSALVARGMRGGAADTPAHRAAAAAFAVLSMGDMALSLMAGIELTRAFVLPQAPRWVAALLVAVCAPIGLGRGGKDSVPRMAYFLRWFFVAVLLVSIVIVLPEGDKGYLFPWAGFGVRYSLRAGAWMMGGLWCVTLSPLYARGEDRAVTRRAAGYRPFLFALALFVLMLLCCAYLLPARALSGALGFAQRLQMLMVLSPSALSWSVMLVAQIYLFLLAFTASGEHAAQCLRDALGGRNVPLWLLALLCVPPSAVGVSEAEPVLVALMPWRLVLSLAALLTLFIANRAARKGEKA